MSGLDVRFWTAAIDAASAAFAAAEAELCALDGAIGDGDHGSSMLRGFQEAQAALRERPAACPGEVCTRAGEAFVDNVGGVTGMVFGSWLAAAGREAGAAAEIDARGLHAMFDAGLAEVKKVGKAAEGDKCMVDAISPAVEALRSAADAGATAQAALQAAARAAEAGRDATAALEARVGRARYQAGKGVGHVDAGAASVCLFFRTLAGQAAG